jgi:hypothetical protein
MLLVSVDAGHGKMFRKYHKMAVEITRVEMDWKDDQVMTAVSEFNRVNLLARGLWEDEKGETIFLTYRPASVRPDGLKWYRLDLSDGESVRARPAPEISVNGKSSWKFNPHERPVIEIHLEKV